MHCKILFLLMLAPLAPLFADSDDDISVQSQGHTIFGTSHGYYTYQFKVTNTSDKLTHQVELKMPANSYGYQTYIESLTRTIVIPPRSSMDITMLQPPVQMLGANLSFSVDGQKPAIITTSSVNHAQSYSAADTKVLVSQSIKYDDVLDLAKKVSPTSSPSSYKGGRRYSHSSSSTESTDIFTRADTAVSEWYTNWINYSCFDCVMLSASDMTTMPQAVRDAVWDYVRAGGSLCVIGQYSGPDLAKYSVSESDNFASVYYPGFGIVMICSGPDITAWNESDYQRLERQCWHATLQPFMSLDDYQTANTKFPIADIGVPVRGLFTLVLIFALAIGPINLFILSKWKKRLWLLWTVPAMSFITCVAIFVYSVIAEGWTSYSRCFSLTVLDQRDHKAATIGWLAFYSPLSPGDGLHFDPATEITMLGSRSFSSSSSNSRPCSVDLTLDQHLRSGFLKARVPSHFMIRKSQMVRQRMIIEKNEKGQLIASNGLGANVTKFWYLQKLGDKKLLYYAQNIPAGAKVTLTNPQPFTAQLSADRLRNVYQASWPSQGETTNEYLRHCDYIAVSDGQLFIEQAMKKAQPKETQSIILGITEENENAG